MFADFKDEQLARHLKLEHLQNAEDSHMHGAFRRFCDHGCAHVLSSTFF